MEPAPIILQACACKVHSNKRYREKVAPVGMEAARCVKLINRIESNSIPMGPLVFCSRHSAAMRTKCAFNCTRAHSPQA